MPFCCLGFLVPGILLNRERKNTLFKRLLAETLAVISLVCLVCGSALASPERTAVEVSPFEASQGTICVTADVPGRPQAVWFPAWTQADQSDIVWHPAVQRPSASTAGLFKHSNLDTTIIYLGIRDEEISNIFDSITI